MAITCAYIYANGRVKLIVIDVIEIIKGRDTAKERRGAFRP